MLSKPIVGLLPFYLKLYDDCMPERRKQFAPFLRGVCERLNAAGLDVVEAEPCRVAAEFGAAIEHLEARDVDLLVTLHLAYSPSLESIDALCRTPLPLLILDTTMDVSFGQDVEPDRIMYNHGIHGVMDMASMLRRRGRPFEIVAGHIDESDIIDRAVAAAKASVAVRCLRTTRALRVGDTFAGMGDFAVPESVLRDVLGITVDQIGPAELAVQIQSVTDADVAAEMALDRERYDCIAPEAVHARSLRVGLGLRRALENGDYDAFSVNFLAFDQPDGPVCTVPFLEISKAMSRGIGYGGEGDVLTASLTGALARAFGQTTFTEIFCPDWKGHSLFLSHMGEINPDIAADKPRLVEKPFDFTPAQNPAMLACAPQPGPATFVNIAPAPEDEFLLIVAPVEVLEDTHNEAMSNIVRGWIRPDAGLETFLETYSWHGGTHHSALVLGNQVDGLSMLAQFAELDCCIIG